VCESLSMVLAKKETYSQVCVHDTFHPPHAHSPSDCPPEDTGGGAEMDGTVLGVSKHALAQEALVLHLLAHKATRQGQLLSTAHDLWRQALLGNISMDCRGHACGSEGFTKCFALIMRSGCTHLQASYCTWQLQLQLIGIDMMDMQTSSLIVARRCSCISSVRMVSRTGTP